MTIRTVKKFYGPDHVAFINKLPTKMVGHYLVAPYSAWLGIYEDGTFTTSAHVGFEMEPDELPVALVKCPGMANLDMSHYREGFADHISDNECIWECVTDGCVINDLSELRHALTESMDLPSQEDLADLWDSLNTLIVHVVDPEDGTSVGNGKLREHNDNYLYVDDADGFKIISSEDAQSLLGDLAEEMDDASDHPNINTILSHMTSIEQSIEHNLEKLRDAVMDGMDTIAPLLHEYATLLNEANAQFGVGLRTSSMEDPILPTFTPLSNDLRRLVPFRLQDMLGNELSADQIYDVAQVFIGDGNCTMETDNHYFGADDRLDHSRMVAGCDLDLSRGINTDTHQLWVLVNGPNDDPDNRDGFIWIAAKWVPVTD